jgi:hypothetical protein
MFGLVVVHDEAGVDDAGDPAEQRQQDTQDEAENAASHRDGDGREDDAKKITKRFQGMFGVWLRLYPMDFLVLQAVM